MRLNPAASLLGREHAILHGIAREHAVRGFAAPLSIKTVRRGSAVWRTDDGSRVVAAGNFAVVNAGQTYDLEIDSFEPVETFCIFFRSGFADDVAHGLTLRDEDLLERPRPKRAAAFLETVEPISSELSALMNQIELEARWCEDTTDSLTAVVELLVRRDAGLRALGRSIPAVRTATRDEILRRVLRGRDRIASDLAEPLPLEEIARSAGMAPHHFHRSFRRVFGITPLEHRTQLRLERAARRLRESDEPVQDVCTAVGFASLPSFIHRFRRWAGVTPGEYRRTYRGR